MDYDGYISQMMQQSEANNVFNAQQAQINRDFQREMSDTAHQREVKDLIAAGLNPVLSANAGASTASGSMATADTSSASGFANLAKTGLDGTISLALAEINKNAQLEAARISADAVVRSAELAAGAKPLGFVEQLLDDMSYNANGIGYRDVLRGVNGLVDFSSSALETYRQSRTPSSIRTRLNASAFYNGVKSLAKTAKKAAKRL